MGVEEEIKEIEAELQKTKYNKATQGHIGRLKAKLARLKAAPSSKKGGGLGYNIKKTGDATVILVGYPSVGKSTLLNALTNADSKVGSYAFTTLTVIPGALEYRGAHIQILDVPGLIQEASSGKGRGREVLSVLRAADLLIIMVSGKDWKRQKQVIEHELYQAGFRLNQHPPEVKITRKSEGGIRVDTTRKLSITKEAIKETLREFRITNGEILIREKITLDQLVDCLIRNRVYLPAIAILNKSDLHEEGDLLQVSALKEEGIEALKDIIWNQLDLKRIYLKRLGKEPDMVEPLIVRGQTSIKDVAEKINRHLHFDYARIWGPSARFPGQKKGKEFILQDEDIVEIHN